VPALSGGLSPFPGAWGGERVRCPAVEVWEGRASLRAVSCLDPRPGPSRLLGAGEAALGPVASRSVRGLRWLRGV